MAARPPRIWSMWLYDGAEQWLAIQVGSPAWFQWLAAPTTTSFSYPVYNQARGYIDGFMTVRKEGRRRGGSYWRVYRRTHGQLGQIYLGPARQVTHGRLVAVVRTFLAAHYDCPEAEIPITRHH